VVKKRKLEGDELILEVAESNILEKDFSEAEKFGESL
jgi:hypothetical protein